MHATNICYIKETIWRNEMLILVCVCIYTTYTFSIKKLNTFFLLLQYWSTIKEVVINVSSSPFQYHFQSNREIRDIKKLNISCHKCTHGQYHIHNIGRSDIYKRTIGTQFYSTSSRTISILLWHWINTGLFIYYYYFFFLYKFPCEGVYIFTFYIDQITRSMSDTVCILFRLRHIYYFQIWLDLSNLSLGCS